MAGPRAKQAIEAVLATGPTDLLRHKRYAKRRLHFSRLDGEIWKIITFEADRFYDGGELVPFSGMALTSAPRVHELLTSEMFPQNPIRGATCTYRSFVELTPAGTAAHWEVRAGDRTHVRTVAEAVSAVLEHHVLRHLDGIRILKDVLNCLDGPRLDAHSASIRAAVHLLDDRHTQAVSELVRWRSIYTSGKPEDQVRLRREVEAYSRRLGLELPPDDFEPVSEHGQLLNRLRGIWEDLHRNAAHYEHAEKLLAEAQCTGVIPSDLRELVDRERLKIWPTLSTRHLCRLGSSLWKRAQAADPLARGESLRLAKAIFAVVKARGPIPDEYRAAAHECEGAS